MCFLGGAHCNQHTQRKKKLNENNKQSEKNRTLKSPKPSQMGYDDGCSGDVVVVLLFSFTLRCAPRIFLIHPIFRKSIREGRIQYTTRIFMLVHTHSTQHTLVDNVRACKLDECVCVSVSYVALAKHIRIVYMLCSPGAFLPSFHCVSFLSAFSLCVG